MTTAEHEETVAAGQVVRSNQPIDAIDTRAKIDPRRTVYAGGEDRECVWVAVTGTFEECTDGAAKRLAARYAFSGRPDVAVERSVGPTADDGTTPPPMDLGNTPAGRMTVSAGEYLQMAAAANMGKGRKGKTFVTYMLVRPSYTV